MYDEIGFPAEGKATLTQMRPVLNSFCSTFNPISPVN